MMKNILLIISLFSLSPIFASADFDDSKVIKKTFKTTSDFELDLTNKHGLIDIETWNKDSVAVTVTITVQSTKLERLQTIMDQINVHFTYHDDYLSVATEWGSGSNGIRVDFLKMFDAQSVRVDYKVMVPHGVEMEIENKFGDIFMENCTGKLKVDLSHGNFTARELTNAKSIKVQYGKLKVKKIEKGDIIAKFSDVSIEEAGKLNLDITSCETDLDRVDYLVLKSTGDDVEIEEVGEISFSASLSNIEIEKITKSMTGSIKFGSLDVEEIVPQFSGITLDASNTDIQLDFYPQIAFIYTVQLEKGKSFSLPSDGNTLDKDNVFDDIHQYEGTFATIPVSGLPARVNITCKATYLKFGIK